MNNIILSGNLTRDIDLRYTPKTKTAVANVGIAVKRPRSDVTDFFQLRIWGKQAEACEKYLTKGSKVTVKGTLVSETFTDKNGVDIRTVVINCDEIDFPPKQLEEKHYENEENISGQAYNYVPEYVTEDVEDELE